ncbi:MAG: tRNA/rRNA methyltransferase [Parcubacteria group bacterium GW2011_GWB1_56_8]|nr:MAG: tRNA/rRNA methyltransferase [Parcubacteria group bacterium GW2011_GWB1_56_8]
MSDIVVILHNIRSAHNVGSMFRTADAAGVRKIYLAGITPAPVDRLGRVREPFAKVALGAEGYVEWEKVRAAGPLLAALKRDHYKIFAVEQAKRAVPYYAASLGRRRGRAALVLGNEVRGLPAPVLRRADRILEIPMYGRKESLNVAVAFGIVLYHLRCAGIVHGTRAQKRS